MKKMSISATVPENKEKGLKAMSASVEVNYPENVQEAVKLYGEEALLTNAFANWRVTLQANIRGGLKRGETPAAIQARLKDAKMGVAVTGAKIDPQAAFIAKFKSATPAEQAKMLAELKAAAQA